MTGETTDDAVPIPVVPAATVVILRDGDQGIAVLLVCRNPRLAFAGGNWVFPGGRIEEADHVDAEPDGATVDPHLSAARRAAVREAAEETGVALVPDSLVWFAHWTPPATATRRFATHFFATAAPDPDAGVIVDGSEIHDWGWMTAADAMARRDRGEILLRPATWITLEQLRCFEGVDDALATFAAAGPEHFETRLAIDTPVPTALYRGDAGWETADPGAHGPRHRLVMADSAWTYERDGWPPVRPPGGG